MSDGIGQDDDPLGSGERTVAAAFVDLPSRQRPSARVRRRRTVSDRSALARPRALLRVLPRRHRRGAGREPSDRLDGGGRETAAADRTKESVRRMSIGPAVLIAILAAQPQQSSAPAQASATSIAGLPARVLRDTGKLVTARTPLVTLLIGGVAAAAVHPADTAVERRLPKFGTVDETLDAGSALGDGWVQWTTAGVVYGAGLVLRKPAVAEVGTRLVEAQVVAGVTTQLIKYGADRRRPDG